MSRKPSGGLIDVVRGLIVLQQALWSASAIPGSPLSKAIEASRRGSSWMPLPPFWEKKAPDEADERNEDNDKDKDDGESLVGARVTSL